MKRLVFLFFSGFALLALGQKTPSPWQFEAYAEVYYSFDFDQPADHRRPDYLYNFHRHNEVNLNLGLLSLGYEEERLRGRLSLMAGTYAQANLAPEPAALRSIYEAFVGVKLSEKAQWWLDAGVFESHLGFENARSLRCATLTRSLVAENSPYYLSGLRMSWTSANEKWLARLVLANGWQRMQREEGNQSPGIGHQLQYRIGSFLLNSSSYWGQVGANTNSFSAQQRSVNRFFHNFFLHYEHPQGASLTLGLDYGRQERAVLEGYRNWWAPTIIVQAPVSARWDFALRFEHFDDRYAMILGIGAERLYGVSLNFDYQLSPQAKLRLEGRRLARQDDQGINEALTAALAISW